MIVVAISQDSPYLAAQIYTRVIFLEGSLFVLGGKFLIGHSLLLSMNKLSNEGMLWMLAYFVPPH